MFRYGYYEASLKAPSVQAGNVDINGNYVSTMFVYRDAKFKHWREIDVEVTGDSAHSVTMNVLNAEKTAAWSPEIQATQQFNASLNVRADFNTYAFEWLPSGITWYFNGQMIGQHPQGSSLPVPDLSTKIMMNLWIFSDLWDFGGKEGWNDQFPMRSEYDWFRFYRWDGEASYPCASMGTDCLSEDDMYLSSNNPCDGIAQVGTVYGNQTCTAECRSRGTGAEAATTDDNLAAHVQDGSDKFLFP
jgi:beta-glucanase (GH16 family)